MAQRNLTAESRSETGKNAMHRLRSRGRIPGIVYGHTDTRLVSVDEREFAQTFKTVSESSVVTLKLAEGDIDVLVKDYQHNLLQDRVIHLDFYEIDRNKVLRTHVRVRLTGTPVGVRDGGILETLTHELEVECLPKDLPEEIAVDVSSLAIGVSIHVRDLQIPAGVTLRVSPDQTVCLVALQKVVEEKPAAVEAEAAVEGAEAPAAEAGAEGTEAKAADKEKEADKGKEKSKDKGKAKE